jgi:hypothetical protein
VLLDHLGFDRLLYRIDDFFREAVDDRVDDQRVQKHHQCQGDHMLCRVALLLRVIHPPCLPTQNPG